MAALAQSTDIVLEHEKEVALALQIARFSGARRPAGAAGRAAAPRTPARAASAGAACDGASWMRPPSSLPAHP